MTKGSTRFVDSFRNDNLFIIASLAFTDTAVFPLLFLKAGVVQNCRGLVYFKTIQ